MDINGKYNSNQGVVEIIQNGDHVVANYQESGVCCGILNGKKLEGIWKNKKDQGLFEWTFENNGSFSGKYKTGLEAGAMRGRWDGQIQNKINSGQTNFHLYFQVINDNNQNAEFEFDCEFKNLKINIDEATFSAVDYNTLITDPSILGYCKKMIEQKDAYFFENADYFSLRVMKINDTDLDYLWKKNDVDENDCVNLSEFLKKGEISSDNYEEEVNEFRQDYFCSLSYVKAF